mmetsp:Transcript_21168/g.62783  ORF Transcript_21168/g.62783 Transcript_21168/m.62783 type:complete len:120 (+) Transcript_21168:260-619(+)
MDGSLREDLGEWLEAWTEAADLTIAIGMSLCGMHADCVAQRCALEPGRHLVIINLQPTGLDAISSVRCWGLLDNFVSLLLKEMKVKPANLSAAMKQGDEWVRNHNRCFYRTPKRQHPPA